MVALTHRARLLATREILLAPPRGRRSMAHRPPRRARDEDITVIAAPSNAADDARPKAVASGSLFDGPANDSK